MNTWRYRPVPLKFQLSDWTLFKVSLRIQERTARLFDDGASADTPTPPTDELMEGSEGFLIHGQPIAARIPPISRTGNYICYAPLQYQHCYIDLTLPFENYQKKFSAKTRSTLNRKIKKYSEHCGGTIPWKTYQNPNEMREFFEFARAISKLTYQEKLLDAGIPDSEDFIRHAESMAADQGLRAYILFDGERPISYLYCPVHDGVLVYSYLGYDPKYLRMSVGTVLQWLAVEQLFKEGRFRCFDFTEGQSDHKRLFATHQRLCANLFFVKTTFGNNALIHSHLLMNNLSKWIGAILSRLGIKAKIKRLLRHT